MDLDAQPLVSLSLTHVHYTPGDKISYLCAWLALVPQGLCVVYATLTLVTREVEIGLLFAGQLLCEALNWLLKRLIKEDRPALMNGKGYGMPSSHAQFVFFNATAVSLFLLLRHRSPATSATRSSPSAIRPPQPIARSTRIILCLALTLTAVFVTASRVYLNYHTVRQVLIGAGIGWAFGVAWFLVVGFIRGQGWVDWALDTPIFRMLKVRDLLLNEDITETTWMVWNVRRQLLEAARNRSQSSKDL